MGRGRFSNGGFHRGDSICLVVLENVTTFSEEGFMANSQQQLLKLSHQELLVCMDLIAVLSITHYYLENSTHLKYSEPGTVSSTWCSINICRINT